MQRQGRAGQGRWRRWTAGGLVAAALTGFLVGGSAVSQSGGGSDNWASSFENAFISNVTRLTHDVRRAGEGYFSPDGRQLVFQAEKDTANPFFQIFIMDLESGATHQVSPGQGKTTCAFFRAGSDEVEFASSHLDPEAETKQRDEIAFRASGGRHFGAWDYDAQMDIFSARRDGGQLTRLTDALGYDAEGSYSPDGSKIVFCSTRSAYPLDALSEEDRGWADNDLSYFGEIYIMNADGSEQTRLTTWPGYDGGPFFSPDGARIVWRHFHPSGRIADIYTMKLDGSDRRRLTDLKAMSWAPYYHPSSAYVIFTTNRHGFRNFELYMVDTAGEREPVRVTDIDGFDGLPVFSPDGGKLCWTSNRTENRQGQLFLADWNHEAALAALAQSPKR